MEKYVLPQNNNSDFKFPASHLPLQQLGQVSMSQLAVAGSVQTESWRIVAFFAVSRRRAVSSNGSVTTFFRRSAGRAGCQEEPDVAS